MRGDNRTLTHALGDLHLAVRSFGGNGAQIFITRSKAISRPTYNKEYSTPVAFDERGVMKQITYRMQVEGGIRVRLCVGYQVRDPYDGRLKDIVRYDDAGGVFHRHSAGFPPSNDHIPIPVLPGLELDFIESDLATHANFYECEAVKYGYEVSEDADDTTN